MTTTVYHPDPLAADATPRLTAYWPAPCLYMETWCDGQRARLRVDSLVSAGFCVTFVAEQVALSRSRCAWVGVIRAVPATATAQVPPVDPRDMQPKNGDVDARLAAARERARRQLNEDDAA